VQDSSEAILSIITDGDDADLERLEINLRRELYLLDEVTIEPVTSGEVPEGARALEAIAIGQLLVKFGPDALKLLSTTVRAWLQRSSARSVELTINGDSIKLGKASSDDQERLLALFISNHSSAP
jgi:hypothetical protein